MPVISFVSPKGGAGKTTSATLLACELARRASVIVIDADPNRPIAKWAALPGCPENLIAEPHDPTTDIIDHIDQAAARARFVVVDCEGTASLSVGLAIAASDLVVIPTQGSQLDAAQAARAIGLVKSQARASRRQIPAAILLTRTNPLIQARTLRHVRGQFLEHGVPMFIAELNEREAFRAMFSFGGALAELDPAAVANLPKAMANAAGFGDEVLAMLNANQMEAAQ